MVSFNYFSSKFTLISCYTHITYYYTPIGKSGQGIITYISDIKTNNENLLSDARILKTFKIYLHI